MLIYTQSKRRRQGYTSDICGQENITHHPQVVLLILPPKRAQLYWTQRAPVLSTTIPTSPPLKYSNIRKTVQIQTQRNATPAKAAVGPQTVGSLNGVVNYKQAAKKHKGLNPKYNQVHQKIREPIGCNTNYSKAYLMKQGSNPSPFVGLYVTEQMVLSLLGT